MPSLPIDFDDPSIDWSRALPPHIVAEQQREAAAREAASGARRPMTMLHNWPLPEGGGRELRVEIYTPNRRPPNSAGASAQSSSSPAAARGLGGSPAGRGGGGSAVRNAARGLADEFYGEPPIRPVVTAREVGNSHRALVHAREQQTFNAWMSPPQRQRPEQNAPSGGDDYPRARREAMAREVYEQNEQVRRQMLQRMADTQAANDARRRAQERQTQQQHQHGPSTARPSVVGRSPPPSSVVSSRGGGGGDGGLHSLIEAQRRLEREEHAMLQEAMRHGVDVSTPSTPVRQQVVSASSLRSPAVTPPPEVRMGGTPPPRPLPQQQSPTPQQQQQYTPPHVLRAPFAEDDEVMRIRTVADAIVFGAGGQQQLAARGMRQQRARRGAGGVQHYGEGRGGTDIFGAPLPNRGAARARAGASSGGGQGQQQQGGGAGDDGWELNDFSYEALLELGSMAVSTGLGKRQLERYKPNVLTAGDVEALAKDQPDCAICLETYEEGERCLTIQCRHTFHYQCIMQWLARTNKCPVCRFEIIRKE